jgi:hypothetical protein
MTRPSQSRGFLDPSKMDTPGQTSQAEKALISCLDPEESVLPKYT